MGKKPKRTRLTGVNKFQNVMRSPKTSGSTEKLTTNIKLASVQRTNYIFAGILANELRIKLKYLF